MISSFRAPMFRVQILRKSSQYSQHKISLPRRSFSSQQELPPLKIVRDEMYGSGQKVGTVIITHATSFCHNVWDPAVGYLREIMKESNYSLRVVGFDWSGHGGSHKRAPFSDMRNWGEVTPRDLGEVISYVRGTANQSESPIFCVGHSFGAAGAMLTEMKDPGTFRAIVAFEPIIMPVRGMTEAHSWVDSPMAQKAEKRRDVFASLQEAKEYFSARQIFADWHEEALDGYVNGGLIPVEGSEDGSVRLACSPSTEANMYRGWHDGYDRIETIKCPVTIGVGSNTQSMMRYGQAVEVWKEIAQRLDRGKLEIIEDSTHFMVMEQPRSVAEVIFDTIQNHS